MVKKKAVVKKKIIKKAIVKGPDIKNQVEKLGADSLLPDWQPPKKAVEKEEELQFGKFTCYIVGVSPLIMSRFTTREFVPLLGVESPLHNPHKAYQGSIYRNRDKDEPTLIHMPSGAFTRAIASMAVRLPGGGTTKNEILQLMNISNDQINLFGIPKILISRVYNSGGRYTGPVIKA